MRSAIVALCFLSVFAHGENIPCEPAAGFTPVCGFMHPEDLELLDDGETLIVSEYGSLVSERPGRLSLFNTASGERRRLPDFTSATGENWGAADCPAPPGAIFSPHGIHLSERADGRRQLLVVNHGGQERIDYFEVTGKAYSSYDIGWRGCVPAPDYAALNDVAAIPEGGFVVTHMYNGKGWRIGNTPLGVVKSLFGFNTGHVWEWNGSNFHIVKGSEAAFPNGIQISADGNTLFLNAYMNSEVRKIDRHGGGIIGRATAKHIDNIQWSQDGRLLVAAHSGSTFAQMDCVQNPDRVCTAPYSIVAVDPETMETTELFSHEGAPMGAATVAQQVGNRIYMGSFAGDRLVYRQMP